jgi:hypothetical protein
MGFLMSSTATILTSASADLAHEFFTHMTLEPNEVHVDGDETSMTFDAHKRWPANTVRLQPEAGRLIVTVYADEPDGLAIITADIASYLQRVAPHGEVLQIDWE